MGTYNSKVMLRITILAICASGAAAACDAPFKIKGDPLKLDGTAAEKKSMCSQVATNAECKAANAVGSKTPRASKLAEGLCLTDADVCPNSQGDLLTVDSCKDHDPSSACGKVRKFGSEWFCAAATCTTEETAAGKSGTKASSELVWNTNQDNCAKLATTAAPTTAAPTSE